METQGGNRVIFFFDTFSFFFKKIFLAVSSLIPRGTFDCDILFSVSN